MLLPNAETQIDARSYDDQKGEVVRVQITILSHDMYLNCTCPYVHVVSLSNSVFNVDLGWTFRAGLEAC